MLNFRNKTEKTAKSVNEATELALNEMGLTESDVDIEIVDEGTKGFLGLGSKDAKVIVTPKDPIPYMAKAFLSEIFKGMQLNVEIETSFDGDTLMVDLSGENMGIIIGKRGDTLDSLQYLTSLVINRDSDKYVKVTLDTENYREKRYNALIALSDRLAAKVSKTGKKYTLEPMNPYERRIIHANLQANEDVTTFSIGEDPYRKVVIAPKKPVKQTYNKRNSYSSYIPTHSREKEKKHSDFESYFQEHTSEEIEE